MREAIEFIGAENLERIALEVHKPAQAIYLFVSKKRELNKSAPFLFNKNKCVNTPCVVVYLEIL